MKINHLIFPIILIIFVTTSAPAQFRMRVKFAEIANLTYQLDCVANLPISCSGGNLNELWKREFLKSDEDRRMLKEWARLRDFYSTSVRLGKSGESSAYLSLFDKIRIAGFQASSVEDYAQKLDLLTNPADRREFERVVRHFQSKFNVWWRREAARIGDPFAKQTDALLRSPKISSQVKQFYDFYAPILPADYEISFNLFYVPDAVKEPSSGQQLQNYSLMEFKAKEKPAQRVDIAVHELCHFFYDNVPPENYEKLKNAFYAKNRAGAIPAFNLLNETLASAFGNGMIARTVTPPAEFANYVQTKQSFYNNPAIDRAAKAALPWLDEWLKKGRAIHDPEFVNQYISVLEKAFGADLLKPKLYLSEMFLFVDKKYGVSMRRSVRKVLEPASLYASEGSLANADVLESFNSQPRLNSVFIDHPDNIAELSQKKIITEAQSQQIQTEYDAKGAVLFAAERAPFTYIYVIVAKDAEGANKLVEKLAVASQFVEIYKFD
jgi:hypothetical protein